MGLFMKNLFFLAISLSLLAQVSLAQPIVLTLEDALNIALENNANTKVARLEVVKAQAAVDEAFGYALPSVDVSANLSHFIETPKMPFPSFEAMLTNATYGILFEEGVLPEDKSKFLPMGTQLQSFSLTNNYEAKVQISQVLFNSAVLRGIGASQIYLETSQELMRNEISNTVVSVKKAFYGVLLAKEMYDITKASLENFEDNFSNIQALNKAGLAADFDAMQAEVQLENFRPMVLEAENAYENAKNGLKVLLSLDQREAIEVEGSLDYKEITLPGVDQLVQKAMDKNYQLRALEKKIEVDEAFVDLERAAYWPTLAAFGNYTFAGSSDDFDFQNYQSSIIGLNFSINLFNGFRKDNKVEQSLIVKEQTEAQLIQARDYVSSQIRSKLLEMNKVQKNITAQARTVDLAQRSYEISEIRLKEGTGTQLELLNAENQLRQARTNRLKYYYDFIVAQSELNQLLGEIDKDLIDKYSEIKK